MTPFSQSDSKRLLVKARVGALKILYEASAVGSFSLLAQASAFSLNMTVNIYGIEYPR